MTFVTIALFSLLLHYAYRETVSPLYGSIGFNYRAPRPVYGAVALVAAAVPSLFLPRTFARASDFFLWTLYIIMIVPTIMVPQWDSALPYGEAVRLGVVTSTAFVFVIAGISFAPRFRFQLSMSTGAWVLCFALFTLITYSYMLVITGIQFRALGVFDVRDTRIAYLDAVGISGPGLAYLMAVQGNVLNPTLLALGVLRKKAWLLAAGCVGQFAIYSLTGYRTILLAIPVAILLPIFLKGRLSSRLRLFPMLITGLTAFALTIDHLRSMHEMTLLFVGRLLLIPGALAGIHVGFFSGREKGLWGYSFMSPFVSYPYSDSPAALVGRVMSGDSSNYANTNWVGDGYANYGFVGIYLSAGFLVVVLLILNAAFAHLPPVASAAMLLVPCMLLTNTSVFTGILTGGIAGAIVIAALTPASVWEGSPPRDCT